MRERRLGCLGRMAAVTAVQYTPSCVQSHGHDPMPIPDGIWVLELSYEPTKYTLRLNVYGLSGSLGANLSLTRQ